MLFWVICTLGISPLRTWPSEKVSIHDCIQNKQTCFSLYIITANNIPLLWWWYSSLEEEDCTITTKFCSLSDLWWSSFECALVPGLSCFKQILFGHHWFRNTGHVQDSWLGCLWFFCRALQKKTEPTSMIKQ